MLVMRLETIALLFLLAALGTTATAGAQTQPIVADVSATLQEEPSELPGVYEVELLVTVEAAGGQCLCQQTTVHLSYESEDVEEVELGPETYVIDWAQQTGVHEQRVDAQVHVSSLDPDEEANVFFDAEMEHTPDDQISSRSQPASLTLTAPAGSSSQAQNAAGEANATPGPGVAVFAAVVVGLALVSHRARP